MQIGMRPSRGSRHSPALLINRTHQSGTALTYYSLCGLLMLYTLCKTSCRPCSPCNNTTGWETAGGGEPRGTAHRGGRGYLWDGLDSGRWWQILKTAGNNKHWAKKKKESGFSAMFNFYRLINNEGSDKWEARAHPGGDSTSFHTVFICFLCRMINQAEGLEAK